MPHHVGVQLALLNPLEQLLPVPLARGLKAQEMACLSVQFQQQELTEIPHRRGPPLLCPGPSAAAQAAKVGLQEQVAVLKMGRAWLPRMVSPFSMNAPMLKWLVNPA